jgi:hypothetical protein
MAAAPETPMSQPAQRPRGSWLLWRGCGVRVVQPPDARTGYHRRAEVRASAFNTTSICLLIARWACFSTLQSRVLTRGEHCSQRH